MLNVQSSNNSVVWVGAPVCLTVPARARLKRISGEKASNRRFVFLWGFTVA